MNQRIMFGTQIVMIVTLLVLCAVAVVWQRQNQRFQQSLIARLEPISPSTSEPQPMTIRFDEGHLLRGMKALESRTSRARQ